MKLKNKKGVSIIVGYVLLVVIAVALSALLYAFLKVYVPKEKPECKEGINIAIQEVECLSKTLTVTLQNRGRFKISAVYIRIGNTSREFREWINDPNDPNVNPESFYPKNETLGQGFFPGETKQFPKNSLFNVDSIVTSDGKYVLEAQPAIFTGRETPEELALCPPITQNVYCTA